MIIMSSDRGGWGVAVFSGGGSRTHNGLVLSEGAGDS